MKPSRPSVTAVGATLVAMMLSATTWYVTESIARSSLHSEAELLAQQMASRLHDCVDTRVEMLEAMRREWRAGALRDERSRAARAEALIATFSGFLAVSSMDGDGVIRQVYPYEPNTAAQGRSIFEHPDPDALPALIEAASTGQPTLTGPIDLLQGGEGFAIYLMRDEDRQHGFINGVFRFSALVPSCLDGPLRSHVLSLRDGSAFAYSDALERTAEPSLGVVSSFLMRNRVWTLQLAPTHGHVETALRTPRVFFFISMFGALTLGMGLFVFLRFRERSKERERQYAAEREKLEDELMRAQKMEALGRLAGGVAHDFNNLLTGIKLIASRLERHEERAKVKESLQQIEQTADSAMALTRQLLTFARWRENLVDSLPIAPIITRVTELVQRTTKGEILIVREMSPESLHVVGDPTQLEQVFMNLLVNARDAMPAGGEIVVRTARDGEFVVVDVIDEGVGIDPAILHRIFEPYFTTKDTGSVRGTGLGLSTAYGIVERHGGKIECMPLDGRGTWMRVSLRPAASPALEPAPSQRREPIVGGHGTVLVVDDDRLVLRATVDSLQTLGYDVLSALEGAEAIEIFKSEQANISAVLMDLRMPEMSGRLLYEALREIDPHVRVVIASGDAVGEELDALKKMGLRVFIAKPYNLDELGAAIAEAIKGV